jgi:hydrogenase nickel incorporation protein HypA/HybF
MHETAIAHDIIKIVEETLRSHPPSCLKTVKVAIGEMIAVVPELLQHAYDSLIFDTPLDNSTLDISIIPISAICQSCQKSFGLNEYDFLCPNCQSANIQVKTGNEFFIKELEVEPCP